MPNLTAPGAVFQSTHPVRGATRSGHMPPSATRHFNPRTPCGVRPDDPTVWILLQPYFNPRTPCGVRPSAPVAARISARISIHAPRAGCDDEPRSRIMTPRIFQSTHPVRGATLQGIHATGQALFQSTHPVRGATALPGLYPLPSNFNPRTPCGVRLPFWVNTSTQSYFNPRTPCGVRRGARERIQDHRDFNPRTPCGVRHRARRAQ